MVLDLQAMQEFFGSKRGKHLLLLAVNSATAQLFTNVLVRQFQAFVLTSVPPLFMLDYKLEFCIARRVPRLPRCSGSQSKFTLSRCSRL